MLLCHRLGYIVFGYLTCTYIMLLLLKTSKEMNKIHNELNEKVSEIKHLELELTRRENEGGVAVDSLKRLIKTLEKENTTLKVGMYMHYHILQHHKMFTIFVLKN